MIVTATHNAPAWTPPSMVVQPIGPMDMTMATALANELDVELMSSADTVKHQTHWCLQIAGGDWQLRRPDGAMLTIDLARQKRAQGTAKFSDPLARAMGLTRFRQRHGRLPMIVDATAGLGRDAWLLASLGCTMLWLERSKLLHAMLQQALNQAAQISSHTDIVDRINLSHADATDWLGHNPDGYDVIYIDPMFPPRRKSAAVKKDMQFLQALLNPDSDDGPLLTAALAGLHASTQLNRVVVKRPQNENPIISADAFGGQLTTLVAGIVRFDIYHADRAHA